MSEKSKPKQEQIITLEAVKHILDEIGFGSILAVEGILAENAKEWLQMKGWGYVEHKCEKCQKTFSILIDPYVEKPSDELIAEKVKFGCHSPMMKWGFSVRNSPFKELYRFNI